MHGPTAFVTVMVWSMSALAQATETPTRPDSTPGGVLYGLGALVAAAVIGAIVYTFIKRNRNAR